MNTYAYTYIYIYVYRPADIHNSSAVYLLVTRYRRRYSRAQVSWPSSWCPLRKRGEVEDSGFRG